MGDQPFAIKNVLKLFNNDITDMKKKIYSIKEKRCMINNNQIMRENEKIAKKYNKSYKFESILENAKTNENRTKEAIARMKKNHFETLEKRVKFQQRNAEMKKKSILEKAERQRLEL